MEEQIIKSLEVWVLQNLLNGSIVCGMLAAGLAMIQDYYHALEKHLTLRVSIELWRILTVVLVDVLLAVTVLIGYLVLNPDIMSDIKMAVPFCPIATLCFAAALVLRLFHGGHDVGSRNYFRSLYLMFAGCAVNVVGFTFVMEAPGHEYLDRHPSEFWKYVETHLRSNSDPYGIDLSQTTFYVCLPLLLLVTVWGIRSALRRISAGKGE